jgi:heme/copper-type cytochrome/quinol oxidase subunit 2
MIMYYITVLIFVYVLATMYTSLYSYRKKVAQLEDKLKTKVFMDCNLSLVCVRSL